MVAPTGKRITSSSQNANLNLEIGNRVLHQTFGMGTVIALTGAGDKAEATINFGTYGDRRLLLRYAPVEKI
jgi:DNA helicase-2/ATP-dependent DNA helicase PcrA